MTERMTAAQYRALMDAKATTKGEPPRPWSNARPTDCKEGHHHPSRLEARVCERLTLLAAQDRLTLYQQVRMPLFSLAPEAISDRAAYLTVDFVLVRDGKMVRVIDAKSNRKSRDWKRGALAFESTYGIVVEEMA